MITASGAGVAANFFSTAELLIPNYANTTMVKTLQLTAVFGIGMGAGGRLLRVAGGIWNSVAAINRLTFSPSSGNFVAGSRAVLYGIV
jgi:hypothetical protein